MIEQVSGQSVFNFAYRYLFQPLGITTYAADDDDLAHEPMVGFQLKALDLAKIGYLLAQEGTWDGQRIVSKEWVRGLFFKIPHAEFDDTPGGSWVKTTIRGHESLVARGEGGGQYTDILAPNYVFSTPVPQDILDFFHQFAQDIVSRDTRRIAENYARGYDHGRDTFASPSRLMFGGGGSPPHLEYVHITKIRIENNRA